MEGNNGQVAVVLPSDPAHWETALQQATDERTQPFAAVAPEHSKFYESDMTALDTLEASTLAAIAVVKQETMPQYQHAKVQAEVEKALKSIESYEGNRVARLEAEVGRLKAQAPKPPERSEIEAHRFTSLTIYRLQQLEGRAIEVEPGKPIRVDLNDPLHFRLLYETLMSAGEVKAISALLDDALDRHLRFLTPEQRERGNSLLGMAASPELKSKIEGYEGMINRYRSKIASMRRRFVAQGWTAPDPLVDRAAGVKSDAHT
jgi:hypothetical protein